MIQSDQLSLLLPPIARDEGASIHDVIAMARESVEATYHLNLGFCASAVDHFYKTVWPRDLFLASTFVTDARLKQTVETILNHQHSDGALPHRVEMIKFVLNLWLPPMDKLANWMKMKRLGVWMKRLRVSLITRKRPLGIYEETPGAVPARDTVPALIIMVAQIYRALEDRDAAGIFLQEQYHRLKKALTREERLYRSADGLMSSKPPQDWLDNIRRSGELCLINMLFHSAYCEMAFLAKKRHDHDYEVECTRAASTIRCALQKFWNQAGYFQASQTDTRLDVPANIVACLYSNDLRQFLKIQNNIKMKAGAPSGLVSAFDRPYPFRLIRWYFRVIRFTKYGHIWLYPWISQLNMLAKIQMAIKVAKREPEVARKLLQEAREDFIALTKIHQKNGGFYEVLDRDTLSPACHRLFHIPTLRLRGITVYQSCKGFLGSSSTYCAVYNALQKIGLLEVV